MRPVQITTGRHPYEVAVLAASLIGGVVLPIVGDRPRSVTAAMPPVVQVVWVIGLVAAGAVGLVGVLWSGKIGTSLGVELAGVTVLGTATTMYTIALLVVAGTQGVAAGAFVGGISAASWVRVWQIVRDRRRLAHAEAALDVADVPLLMERVERDE